MQNQKTLNLNKKRVFKGIDTSKGVVPNFKSFDLDLVKRDLLLFLHTPKGSRVMLPNFGTTIWEKLFEPYSEALLLQIRSEVEYAIRQDPRLELITIQTNHDPIKHTITVAITCNFKPYNVIDTFFTTFQLNQQQLMASP